MIKSLTIKNFILIKDLTLNFKEGFNVITGETGAGKSIILNAIDIAFGARTSKEFIKTGEEREYIEVLLNLKEDFDFEFLNNNGIEFYDNELILSREISQTGSRSRVNGVVVTQEFMKDLKEKLLDIHSQHQTYTYIQPKYHINLLDSYANVSHKELLKEYENTYNNYINILKEYENLKQTNNLTENQIDFLKFQIQEIEEADIEDINEDKNLENQLNILLNAETLKDLTYSGYYILQNDDNSLLSGISQIKTNISKAVSYDENLSEIEEEIINLQENLKDIASTLRNYSENIELDKEKIDFIQERINLLDKLKRKYGNSLEEVLNSYQTFNEELSKINLYDENIEKLENQLKDEKDKLMNVANSLSQSRQILAKELSEKITQELEKLELPKSSFEISITQKEFDKKGIDNVEFLISTNISEEVKPLIKVASGGEISRVMLAIKTIFAQADKVNTVIFDEIDTGISGKASQSVADELYELSKHHQIIAITHQPIIAAKANQHFYVTKTQDETTNVRVYTLDEENKIKAIAMLAAGEINDESISFAKQLIGN